MAKTPRLPGQPGRGRNDQRLEDRFVIRDHFPDLDDEIMENDEDLREEFAAQHGWMIPEGGFSPASSLESLGDDEPFHWEACGEIETGGANSAPMRNAG